MGQHRPLWQFTLRGLTGVTLIVAFTRWPTGSGASAHQECSRPCPRPAANAASLDLESDTFGAVQHYIRNCRRWKLASEVR